MPTIKKIMTVQEAYNKYAALCAKQECCQHDLKEKMYRNGMQEDAIQRVLQQLMEEGFIDENRYARAFAHDKLNYSHHGKIRIRIDLCQRQIKEADIEDALLYIDEEDYKNILTTLLQTYHKGVKAKSEYELYSKMMRYGYSRGFEPDLVREVVEQITNVCP